MELFVAGKRMVVESSYKAAYDFIDLSQGDIDDLDLPSFSKNKEAIAQTQSSSQQ